MNKISNKRFLSVLTPPLSILNPAALVICATLISCSTYTASAIAATFSVYAADALAQPVPNLPSAIVTSLTADGHADVLVSFDSTAVQNEIAILKNEKHLRYDDEAILALRKDRYSHQKALALSLLGTSDVQVLKDYDALPMTFVRVNSAAALKALQNSPYVTAIGENAMFSLSLPQSLPLLNQPIAQNNGMVGNGVTVAVIDTGINYTQPAFGCTSPGVPAACRVILNVESDTYLSDGDGDGKAHGTNVGAIVAGVAPGAKLISLDVWDENTNSISTANLVSSFNWIINNAQARNIKVVNMSIGNNGSLAAWGSYSPNFSGLLSQLKNMGIATVVSSGNNGATFKMVEPAFDQNAISVAAVYDSSIGSKSWENALFPVQGWYCVDNTTATDQLTCFSNIDFNTTLLAPGAMITAGGLTQGGTSQAAPHVAGAYAVLVEAYPGMTVDQRVQKLQSTGDAVYVSRIGQNLKRINIGAAVQDAINARAMVRKIIPIIDYLLSN